MVDDEESFRDIISNILPQKDYNLSVFERGDDVLRAIEEREFDIGLIDINMPGMNGLELIQRLKSQNTMTELIVITGYVNIPTAVETIKLGCYDYITKPVSFNRLANVIKKAYERLAISRENLALRRELESHYKYFEMIGKSVKMKNIFSLIDKVAVTSSSVLIQGESGTGKELVARAIHKRSDRCDKPFIIIDCATLSETLLENELFGHEKEAFTGAKSLKRGLFEIGDEGTLFIDEIGEMKTQTQSKLLRVIETCQFRRLGGNTHKQVDVRIIAATNRNLAEEVKKGVFREDLFYRINIFPIHLPPLRERKEDIPLLIEYFIQNTQVTRIRKQISDEAIQLFMAYNWPGNVRELANVVERALIISTDEKITPKDLPFDISRSKPTPAPDHLQVSCNPGLSKLVKDFEEQTITRIIEECDGNKIKAAKLLKISRAKLYRKLSEYGIGD